MIAALDARTRTDQNIAAEKRARLDTAHVLRPEGAVHRLVEQASWVDPPRLEHSACRVRRRERSDGENTVRIPKGMVSLRAPASVGPRPRRLGWPAATPGARRARTGGNLGGGRYWMSPTDSPGATGRLRTLARGLLAYSSSTTRPVRAPTRPRAPAPGASARRGRADDAG